MLKIHAIVGLILLFQLNVIEKPSHFKKVTSTQRLSFNPSFLTGKTWKIDQLYVDSVRILDTSVQTLRFTFGTNANLTVTSGAQSTVKLWQSNASQDQILIKNTTTGVTEETYTVIFLDASRFIYRVYKSDVNTGQQILTEYRLIPI